jgi:hypothetical protein
MEDIKKQLEDAKNELKMATEPGDKEFWREEVRKWGDALRDVTTQTGNDFVTLY